MTLKALYWPLPAALLLCLCGCQSLTATDYGASMQQARQSQPAWQAQQGAVAATQLTDLIGDNQLTELIAQAQRANPGLQQTLLSLKIAYTQQRDSEGSQLPQVNLGFGADKQEDASSRFDADLTIGWELDLWRRLRDATSAAELDSAATLATTQGARDALAANVMRTYLQLSLRRQLLAIETDRLAVLDSNRAMVLQRYRAGLGQLQDLDDATSSSATTRATIADYRQQLVVISRTLQKLTGQPIAVDAVGVAFPEVLLPLAGLPEQDLNRRPDLQAAYFDTQASQFRAQVAYKSLLPSISLSVALSDVGNNAGDALFASPAWSLLGQLTAPLFQGGKLRAQAEIAELRAEQSFWRYQEVLLNAVIEVDNALDRERALARQQQHLATALSSADRSVDSYRSKYRQGLVNILDLLSVQQQRFNLQSQLTEVTYNRLANRIDLGLALGLGVSV